MADVPRRVRLSSARPTESVFADFLSDGSGDEDEDEDDADARALLRMQQQADDSAYSGDAPLEQAEGAFRLVLKQPGDVDDDASAGPLRLVARVQVAASVDDVMDLVSKVERASRAVDDHLVFSSRGSAVATEEEARGSKVPSPQQSPQRKTSVRETESGFADFLSDGSNSGDEEDEDDADTRALLRMQQQADDRAYLADTSLEMAHPPTGRNSEERTSNSNNNSSFRLTLAKPGVFEDDALMGPRKLVEEAMRRESTAAAEQVHERDEDSNSWTGASFLQADAGKRSSEQHDSVASRPPSFEEEEGDSFFDEPRPSFSDEHSFTGGGESFTDNSFVYRPSLPDEEEEATQSKVQTQTDSSFVDASAGYRPSSLQGAQDPAEPASSSSNDHSFVYRPSLPDSEKESAVADAASTASVGTSFVYRPSLLPGDDGETQDNVVDRTETAASNSSTAADNSFAFRPTLLDDEVPKVVYGYTRPASTNTSTADESTSENRPSLPGAVDEARDNNSNTVPLEGSERTSSGVKESLIASGEDHEDKHQPSFLSPRASSFIRSSDAVAFSFGGVDSSFRILDGDTAVVAAGHDSFSSVLTDSCASAAPPKLDTEESEGDGVAAEEGNASAPAAATALSPDASDRANSTPAVLPVALCSDDKFAPVVDTKVDSPHASAVEASPSADAASTQPPLSRQSSAASSTRSSQDCLPQRRMTATRESWRVSSLDLRESKHAFDEELGPLAGHPPTPRASAVGSEQQRLSSTFEERTSVASASSNSSSFASFHSQANFFVDDIQQSFSSVSSLSLDSRPSGEDSFANVAILGDDGRDQNERRSSDIIAHDAGQLRSSSISAAYPNASDSLDRSYGDLVDVTAALDRSFSKLVDRERFYPLDADHDSANVSANGTSLGSSLASSAVSHSSAASDELSFVSFNVAKPPPPPSAQQQQEQNKEQRSSTTVPVRPSRHKLASESQQASIVLPRGSDVKATKPSRPPTVAPSAYSTGTRTFSSAALLAAIKTRDVRADTRSEETEAGDVALGALPPMAPPLKINVVPRGRGSLSSSKSGAGSSPSLSASPLAMSSMTRSSVASSTGSADHLDFTGVYRGSVNSLEASNSNGVAQSHVAEANPGKASQQPQDEHKGAVQLELLGVKLERSTSDSRMMQRESQRKVEEFFRRTCHKSVAEQEVNRWTNRKTRARTTVIQCADDVEQEPPHFAFDGDMAAKVIDLKNLRNGSPGWHLEEEAALTPQREDSSKQGAMGMTTGTTSTGTTATRSMPSDLIPMSTNYVISPQGADSQQRKVLAKKKKKEQVAKAAAAAGRSGDGVSRFGAISGRRADNVSLTPTLPRLSTNESPAFSPFVTPLATPNAFGGSGGVGIGRSPGKSPVAFAGTASGFLWKAGSGFNGLQQSAADAPFDASQASYYTQRPTLADRVESLSASLASTLRRFLPGNNSPRPGGNPGVTSPQSQCTAPAALPKAYDHNGFYEAPFKVPGLNKPLEQRRGRRTAESDQAWVRQWLVLATCAVLGLSLGAILVRVVIFDSTAFNLSADEVHERQESNGEMVFAAGVRWLLLPGHLFLCVWSAVTTLLLFCYVATSLADLVGCADKSALVLSFRSIGYTVLLAVLATLEGVLAMWLTHKSGWFQGESSAASAEASTLAAALGVMPLPEGAVGLLCSGAGEYLQRLGHDVFACSNASLTLPLYEEVATNSTGVSDSGPAVFALQEVTGLLAAPTPSVPYYPASLGSGGSLSSSLLWALTPDNLASQFTHVELDEMASRGGLLVFGLLLGYVCGKRILRLRRDTQAAMFESARSDAPAPRHYVVGILMELQLALEWLVRPMERYLAPLGFFSLTLGHVVRHHREWRSFTSPMVSLLVGVLVLIVVHAVVVLPIVFKQFSSSRRHFPLLVSTRAFVPAFLVAFTTDNVALAAPVTMQCHARVRTVTRSAAQLATTVTAALTRNARALYLPLLLLWLLETSSSQELKLNASDYLSVGLASLLSSFCGGSTRLTLAMARTLWSIAVREQSPSAAHLLPSTMPLLVVCDAILSRMASVVTLADHLVLTHLAAQHWGETVVNGSSSNGPSSSSNANYVPSPSPLDDSQVPRPSSSAMLSSVYL
ncbi:ribosomal protein S14, S11 [Phytophthora pseudosyringae]|uniref:Ribosomal protein S14, S11 n=1 Tax=Phytophthora pseudosyringae TaxID=221518 RepID=A0A8T1VHD9_9STRA|nr:ribosomal protein S14, S11 [Phytophthora pseudosyringae]